MRVVCGSLRSELWDKRVVASDDFSQRVEMQDRLSKAKGVAIATSDRGRHEQVSLTRQNTLSMVRALVVLQNFR